MHTKEPAQKTNSRLCLGEKERFPASEILKRSPQGFAVFYGREKRRAQPARYPCPSLSRVQLQPADNVTCAESTKLGAFREISSEEPKETGRWWKIQHPAGSVEGRSFQSLCRGRLGYFLKWHMESEAVLREENSSWVTGQNPFHKFLCHASHCSFGARLSYSQAGWQFCFSVSGWKPRWELSGHVQGKLAGFSRTEEQGWLRKAAIFWQKTDRTMPWGPADSSLLSWQSRNEQSSLATSKVILLWRAQSVLTLTVSLMHKYQLAFPPYKTIKKVHVRLRPKIVLCV